MIYFRSDYSQGAHPKVMEALVRTNTEHTDGYGIDQHCENAADMIRKLIGVEDCSVHMMVGGTPCNVTVIAAALRPYESVVTVHSGHAYHHETGAVEATGHRVTTVDDIDGKMTPEAVDLACEEHEDEHTPLPRMVYISQPTEIGTIYSKAELIALRKKCVEKNMFLYVDGARLGSALTSEHNDLSIQDLARLCDAFYIGGTKQGALFGEAVVITNDALKANFRYCIKQGGGMLAKGRLLGVQFAALFEDGLYLDASRGAVRQAARIREAFEAKGIGFLVDSPTNQVFPILTAGQKAAMAERFGFETWQKLPDGRTGVRFCTCWATPEANVDALVKAIETL